MICNKEDLITETKCSPECPDVARERAKRLHSPSHSIHDAAHDATQASMLPPSASAQTSRRVFAVIAIMAVIGTTQVIREVAIIFDMSMTCVIAITLAIAVISMICAIGKEEDAEVWEDGD